MPKKKSASASREEVQVAKSPAEFFAENQAIAGFDNMGKSLYTTIRELVENSLDACESVNVLPDIAVHVEELTMAEFNAERGVSTGGAGVVAAAGGDDAKKAGGGSSGSAKKGKKKGDSSAASSSEGYFRIRVRDNGCGMKHDAIPTCWASCCRDPSTASGRRAASSAWGPRWR